MLDLIGNLQHDTEAQRSLDGVSANETSQIFVSILITESISLKSTK